MSWSYGGVRGSAVPEQPRPPTSAKSSLSFRGPHNSVFRCAALTTHRHFTKRPTATLPWWQPA